MQKNLIIGGLLVWNLILMAALIFIWTSGRRWQQGPETARGTPESRRTKESEVGAVSDEEVFTFKAGDRKVGDQAPPVVNRDLTITATFDTQGKDGVIVAHGGLAQGYAVYVQQGQMFFVVRRHNALTTVEGEKVAAGQHTFTATFARTGELSLTLDGKRPV